jgi:hypothetical protein
MAVPSARTSADTSPVLTALATLNGCARSSQIVIAAIPAVTTLAMLARLNTTLSVRFISPDLSVEDTKAADVEVGSFGEWPVIPGERRRSVEIWNLESGMTTQLRACGAAGAEVGVHTDGHTAKRMDVLAPHHRRCVDEDTERVVQRERDAAAQRQVIASLKAIVVVDDTEAPGALQRAIERATPGQTILVAGTCQENVSIPPDKDRLTLDGGGSGVIEAPDVAMNALQIRGPRAVTVRGLTVRGGRAGIDVQLTINRPPGSTAAGSAATEKVAKV